MCRGLQRCCHYRECTLLGGGVRYHYRGATIIGRGRGGGLSYHYRGVAIMGTPYC